MTDFFGARMVVNITGRAPTCDGCLQPAVVRVYLRMFNIHFCADCQETVGGQTDCTAVESIEDAQCVREAGHDGQHLAGNGQWFGSVERSDTAPASAPQSDASVPRQETE